MRLLPWQDAIFTQLRTQLGDHIPVEDGGYDEGEDVGTLPNGMIAPYVLVWFGGSISALAGTRGIAGIRRDTRQGILHIECVATTHTMARQLGDEVRDALVGFTPVNGGELAEDGAPTIRNPISTTTGVDVRYSYPLAFTGLVNTVVA